MAASLVDLEQLFSSRMAEYENKLRNLSSTPEPAPDVAALSREFADFKTFVWQALTKFRSQIEMLSSGYDRHETMMRRKVLLFHGVAELPNEKVVDVVHKVITEQMGLSEIRKDSVHVCHRLGSSQGKVRPVLVRLYTSEHRHIIWENKKALKGTGVTISEFLTHTRHRTFMDARKYFGVPNCWSVEGRIVIVTPDGKRHKLETPGELRTLVSRYPKAASDADIGDAARSGMVHTCPKSPTEVPATPSKGQRKARRRN